MGFYGNITNTSKTQFQFDKIYSNRVEMERNLLKDNVYIGRYVLIEYDSEVQRDDILRVYTTDKIIFYLDSSEKVELTKGQIGRNELVYTYDGKNTYVYYQCVSDYVSKSEEPAQFEKVNINTDSNYTRNYHIDLSAYNSGRGYDSTVWQKVYTNNAEKYVMIAELNSVVPTFTVVADPPTMNPIAPHFDTESTDVYYKLHWQTPWGFRIAAAEEGKSDGTTQWTTTTYNPSTGKNTTKISNKNAAIYFNKDAFDPQLNADEIKKKDTSTNNEIKVVPTSSGQKIYNDHSSPGNLTEADDIQEMTINLPAIGNMMSDAWDIIHGPRRNNDMREIDPETGDYVASLKGRLDSIDAIAGDEIPVKRHDNGQLIGSKVNGGKTDEDDKTGVNDDAWIETIVDAATNTISIHHKFNRTKNGNTFIDLRKAKDWGHDTTDSINMNKTADDNFNIVTPIIDDMGHVVGENTQTITLPYNFKTIKTNGVSTATSNPLVTENVDIAADNSKDDLTIAAGNKWIRMANNSDNDTLTIGHEVHAFTTTSNGTTNLNEEDGAVDENNINIPDWDYDEAGHIKSKQDHYYTLPFSFKTFNVSEISEDTKDLTAAAGTVVADNTQDTLTMTSTNKWIHLAADSENDTIKLAHEVNNIDTTDIESTDLNNPSSDSINIPDWSYDEAGHIISKQKHKYTLPYGFKTIKTNGRDNTNVSENANGAPTIEEIVADNTQDVLTINSGNKWIRIDTNSENDSLTISHDIHDTSNDESTTDWTIVEENTTIPVVNYNYDNAGHYVSHHTENYKLPFGYGKIKGDNDTSTAATATHDELTFGSDEWLTATIEKDKVIYSHDYPKEQEDTESSFDMNSGINNNTIILETLTHDDKGHIVNVNQHTVTLPYGYKEFRDSNIEVGQSIANNTQDVFVFKGDTWIKPTVSTDLATFTHIGPVSGTHTSKINNEPKFGETFVIEDHYFDDKGHKYSTETHTILLPKGSLDDKKSNEADVITQLTFTDTTGALSSTRTNISKLLLTGYEKKADNSDIAETDTLGSALSKLQTQIHDEETARANANTVLQESLKDEITRAKTAEEQVLTDAKAYTDQVKKAILTGESADILGETYDTLLEISNWINGDGVNTTELIDAIAVESNRAKEVEANLGTLITNEATNRENAIKASIESLDVEDSAIDGEYISSVSQTDGKIKIERKSLPIYTLVESDTNGSINFNGVDVPVHGLGSVAYESVDSFVKVEDFNAAIAEKDQEIYTLNSRCNTLDTEVKNLINLVNDLTTRITKLEEQNNTAE